MPEDELVAEFDKCPVCGYEGGLMRMLVDEEMEKGTVDKDTVPCLMLMSSIAVGPNAKVLIGQMANVGTAVTEACPGCGIIRATKLFRGKAALQMPAPATGLPIVMPKQN